MHRPLPQDHPILLEKGVPFHHPLSSAIQHPSPHGGTCVFCKWESRHPGKRGHDLNPMDFYTSTHPYQGGLCSSLFQWLKGQRPLWLVTQKAEVDTESYTARIVSTANVRRPITQVTPLAGTCLRGPCPFGFMLPSFISSRCFAFSSLLF